MSQSPGVGRNRAVRVDARVCPEALRARGLVGAGEDPPVLQRTLAEAAARVPLLVLTAEVRRIRIDREAGYDTSGRPDLDKDDFCGLLSAGVPDSHPVKPAHRGPDSEELLVLVTHLILGENW